MNTNDPSGSDDPMAGEPGSPIRFQSAPIVAGLLAWGAISLGFLGLILLMQERPQFVGQPLRVSKAELVQDSPQLIFRTVSDDVSVFRPMQPEFSDVQFRMSGQRDYRGLRTIMDMSGEFRARYRLTNAFDEAAFVLFRCAHPRARNQHREGVLAGGLRLQSSAGGIQENVSDAWVWSGMLDPRGSAEIEISYQAASLKSVVYRVGEHSGNPVRQHRVTFHRQDLDTMRFESGDGAKQATDAAVVWERVDFLAPDFFSAEIVEGRNLYASLSHLLEMGPLISLLFLLSVTAVTLARQRLTALQVVTIAASYALYFPLILYLSSRFSFAVALVMAVAIPGALLLNYARWLLGVRLGLIGGAVFLALYQVFPTLAAFGGWNRGMVLLCLGVVTLWVLINLQNQALKRKATVAAATAALLLCLSVRADAAGVQVILPGELAAQIVESKREPPNALVAFEPAHYDVRHEAQFLHVQVHVPFETVRGGNEPVPLFTVPVHLQESQVHSGEADVGRLVSVSNRLGFFVQHPGAGMLSIVYRVPVANHEGKRRAQMPLLAGTPGTVRLESPRHDLEILSGGLWSRSASAKATVYEIGVANEETLIVEWREQDGGGAPPVEGGREFYGIGLTRAQNLTVIHSDGSCTHFAEFEIPAFQSDEFRMRLPGGARLISVSLNGTEIGSPAIQDGVCRVRLPGQQPEQAAHRLSFRIAYPPMRLGFVGTAELALPELFQTAGTLEWVVALPAGFAAQVLSGGLETQKAAPDLVRFGDYGRILKSQPHTYLARSLAPPGTVSLQLKYRQAVPGFFDAQAGN